VPNVMKIWEPEPPENLWFTPGLLRDSFTIIYIYIYIYSGGAGICGSIFMNS
jgi:hypothetical protein